MSVLHFQAAVGIFYAGLIVGHVVVVRRVGLHIFGRIRAILILVQRGILGVVIEAVSLGRHERSRGVAGGVRIALVILTLACAGVQVGVEVGLVALLDMGGNIAGQGGIGDNAGFHLLLGRIFQADGVENMDRIGRRDLHRDLAVLILSNIIIPQGQQGSRDLDFDFVAGLKVVVVGDRDNDFIQVDILRVGNVALVDAVEGIGGNIAAGLFGGSCVDFIAESNGIEIRNGHVIAQGVLKRYIAALGSVFARFHQRGDRGIRGDICKDFLEYGIQFRGFGGGFVVVGIFGAGAHRDSVTVPVIPRRRRSGIVAGNGVHETVGKFLFVLARHSGRIGRIRTAENTDSVNGGTTVF